MRGKDLVVLLLILGFVVITRLWRLDWPPAEYFDESYQVAAAQLMVQGQWWNVFDPTSPQEELTHFDWLHPPLFKYFLALALWWGGYQSWVWRFPSVLLGVAAVILFYFFLENVARFALFQKAHRHQQAALIQRFSLIGTALLAINGLFLVQSRLAMNDILAFFCLLCIAYCYFQALVAARRPESVLSARVWLLMTGLMIGLGIASKWTVAFSWLGILGFELIKWAFLPVPAQKKWQKLPFFLFALVLTPLFSYFLSYLPFFLSGRNLSDFGQFQSLILESQRQNPAQHPYASQPWQWFLNVRPVWYWTGQAGIATGTVSNIYLIENPVLTGYFVVSVLWSLWAIGHVEWRGKNLGEFPRQWLIFFLVFFALNWLPYFLIGRIMFFYHYLLAVIPLTVLTTYGMVSQTAHLPIPQRRAWLFNLLFWPSLVFLIFYPHWTGLPMPSDWVNATYFLVQSWK